MRAPAEVAIVLVFSCTACTYSETSKLPPPPSAVSATQERGAGVLNRPLDESGDVPPSATLEEMLRPPPHARSKSAADIVTALNELQSWQGQLSKKAARLQSVEDQLERAIRSEKINASDAVQRVRDLHRALATSLEGAAVLCEQLSQDGTRIVIPEIEKDHAESLRREADSTDRIVREAWAQEARHIEDRIEELEKSIRWTNAFGEQLRGIATTVVGLVEVLDVDERVPRATSAMPASIAGFARRIERVLAPIDEFSALYGQAKPPSPPLEWMSHEWASARGYIDWVIFEGAEASRQFLAARANGEGHFEALLWVHASDARALETLRAFGPTRTEAYLKHIGRWPTTGSREGG